MIKLQSTGGCKALSHHGKSWGLLKYALQQDARRACIENSDGHAAEIISILYVGNKSNMTSFMRRVMIIASEDIVDVDVPCRLEPYLTRLNNIRSKLGIIGVTISLGILSSAVFNICRILCSSKRQSRGPSSVKAVLNQHLAHPIDITKMSANWKFLMRSAKCLFDPLHRRRDGLINKVGRTNIKERWEQIMIRASIDQCGHLVEPLMTFWLNHSDCIAHYLWPIQAMLIIATVTESELAMEEVVYEELSSMQSLHMFWKYMSMDYNLPSYASEKYSKTSAAGINHFLTVALTYANEVDIVPVEWKRYYFATKRAGVKKDEYYKTMDDYKNPWAVVFSDATEYVLTKIPDKDKAASWLMLCDNTSYFIKLCLNPEFQLFVDGRKNMFGIVPMGVTECVYNDVSYLRCLDAGSGMPYETKHECEVDVLDMESTGPAIPLDVFQGAWTQELAGSVIFILCFKYIMGVSERHLGNILIKGNGKVLSINETYPCETTHNSRDLLLTIASKLPGYGISSYLREWIEINTNVLHQVFYYWQSRVINENEHARLCLITKCLK